MLDLLFSFLFSLVSCLYPVLSIAYVPTLLFYLFYLFWLLVSAE